jgi:hypothetical protein
MSATKFLHNYGMKFNICIMSLGNDPYLGQFRKSGDEIVTGVGNKVMKFL